MFTRAGLSILLFFTCSVAAAQGLKSYFGPTLGISTPDFGRPTQNYLFNGSIPVIERSGPIPSPIAGISAGTAIWKHLALDAGLQYSYTGQSYSRENPQSGEFGRERLWVHKAVLPLTIGYAGNIGRTHIRFGLGGAIQYLFAAKAVFDYRMTNVQQTGRAELYPFKAPLLFPISRFQALPRASFSIAPGQRLMITAAYSRGKVRTIIFDPQFGLYTSVPRNSAIDLTVTYLIRRVSQTTEKAQETSPGE